MAPTQLLVSVRDAQEAIAASSSGAAIVDIKDPAQGSLGAPIASTAANIVAALQSLPRRAARLGAASGQLAESIPAPRKCQVSVAMGELVEWSDDAPLNRWLRQSAAESQLHYAKIGLAQAHDRPNWPQRWWDWSMSLPAEVHPVAVAYADWSLAGAPDPWAVLQECPPRCPGVLLDTFTKDGRCLFDHLEDRLLADWIAGVRRTDRWVALAGSLRLACVPRAVALRPRYLAVRGGVCVGGRTGAVHAPLVAQWVAQLTRQAEIAHGAR